MRKKTIWESLAEKLEREPTHSETCEEVKRVLQDALIEHANEGKLAYQKKR